VRPLAAGVPWCRSIVGAPGSCRTDFGAPVGHDLYQRPNVICGTPESRDGSARKFPASHADLCEVIGERPAMAARRRVKRCGRAGDKGGRPARRVGGSDNVAWLASRSAQALIFGAGLVTVMNTLSSRLAGVNTGALRITGVVTMLASFGVPMLPWKRHARLVSFGIAVAAMIALVGTEQWHHYARNESAIAVYPIFFILVIAWAGLTQPRGTATIVACLSGAALAWILSSGGHGSAAVQCVAVTVPAAAILGEVVSWAYGRAVMLGQLDAARRHALEALVTGATRLQGALTSEESEAIVLNVAAAVFGGRDARYENARPGIDDGQEPDDVRYDPEDGALHIRIRGQSGIIGTVTISVGEPDQFLLDAARLYSHHLGTRLEQLRVIDALTDAATHDPLTGIGNRRAAEANVETLAPGDVVLLLDLDHFKTINDTLGHQRGDQVLAQLGEYLRNFTRPSDTVARYGGEEFLLICRSVPEDAATHIAHRLLDGWRAQQPLVTFSIGYSAHKDGEPAELTIEHADTALYQAKREGRDRAHQFTPTDPNVHPTITRA